MDTADMYTSENFNSFNRAFLYGDAVKVSFFVHNGELVMAEECYFFLMASMRKMRMEIPMTYTLEFFQQLFSRELLSQGFREGIITLMVYRNEGDIPLQKRSVSYCFDTLPMQDVLAVQGSFELDIIKEITVNTGLLDNIRVHCPENVYAEIYATENGLDEVILLNANKRIARSISGNLLFLQEDTIKVARQSEGALISPLMENFVTFLHKNNLARTEQSEMVAFESQKAEEILLVSDSKGIFVVGKIRNRTFGSEKFASWIQQWSAAF
ncbi:aminotransferase class IV [Weeksellaceae bacterium A-14]|uniref:aminotransferase class IV n=1 Tax=Daejeonia sp. YH14 TaxID=3439042 RepID=UPI0031E4BDB3